MYKTQLNLLRYYVAHPQPRMVVETYLLEQNPPILLFLKPNALIDDMIA